MGRLLAQLQLVSDKDGRRWEWRSHEVIVGLDLRALAEEWERLRADDLVRPGSRCQWQAAVDQS